MEDKFLIIERHFPHTVHCTESGVQKNENAQRESLLQTAANRNESVSSPTDRARKTWLNSRIILWNLPGILFGQSQLDTSTVKRRVEHSCISSSVAFGGFVCCTYLLQEAARNATKPAKCPTLAKKN